MGSFIGELDLEEISYLTTLLPPDGDANNGIRVIIMSCDHYVVCGWYRQRSLLGGW